MNGFQKLEWFWVIKWMIWKKINDGKLMVKYEKTYFFLNFEAETGLIRIRKNVYSNKKCSLWFNSSQALVWFE